MLVLTWKSATSAEFNQDELKEKIDKLENLMKIKREILDVQFEKGIGSGVPVSTGPEEKRIAYRSSKSINESISPILEKIMQSYQNEYKKNSNLKGELILSFDIVASGELKNLNVSYNTVTDSKFVDFVKSRFQECRFPPNSEKTEPISMMYPLIFDPFEN